MWKGNFLSDLTDFHSFMFCEQLCGPLVPFAHSSSFFIFKFFHLLFPLVSRAAAFLGSTQLPLSFFSFSPFTPPLFKTSFPEGCLEEEISSPSRLFKSSSSSSSSSPPFFSRPQMTPSILFSLSLFEPPPPPGLVGWCGNIIIFGTCPVRYLAAPLPFLPPLKHFRDGTKGHGRGRGYY